MPNSYFMGLDGFVWFIGVVEDRQDPSKLGRVKVRCLGFHTEDKNDIPTEDLPWAHVMHPVTDPSMQGMGTTPSFLVEGSWVVGFFRDATEKQQPIIMGSLPGYPQTVADTTKGFNDPSGFYPQKENTTSGHALNESDVNRLAKNDPDKSSLVIGAKDSGRLINVPTSDGNFWNEPIPPYGASYPYNHVYESESGHIKEFDDTTGNERIHEYHKSGTFYEIDSKGNKSTRIVGDNYYVVKKSDYQHIAGDLNLTISGNLNIKCKNFNLEVEEDFDENVSGNKISNVSGVRTINVTGDTTEVYGSKHTIEIQGAAVQSFLDTLTRFHIFNPDTQIEPTVTNHHDASVFNYVTGEVEFNTSTNFEIFSGATVNIDATTSVLVDSALVNLNSGTAGAARVGDPTLDDDADTVLDGPDIGAITSGSTTVKIGTSAPTTTDATAPTTSDFVISTLEVNYIEPYESGFGTSLETPKSKGGITSISSSDYVDDLDVYTEEYKKGTTCDRSTLGDLAIKYESKGEVGTIAKDSDGYYSYGVFQIYSKGGLEGSMGQFIKFLQTKRVYNRIGEELANVGGAITASQLASADRKPFDDKWKEIAINQKELFIQAQRDFGVIDYYNPVAKYLDTKYGIDLCGGNYTSGLQDLVFAIAIQGGVKGAKNLISNAFLNSSFPSTENLSSTDKTKIKAFTSTELLDIFHTERTRLITQSMIDNSKNQYYIQSDLGNLAYFRNHLRTYKSQQKGIENRFASELADAKTGVSSYQLA